MLAVRVAPANVQGPDTSAKVTVPVPEPPVVDSADVALKAIVAGVATAARAAWLALVVVTPIAAEVAARKLASAALVAVTLQVPTPVAVRVATASVQGPETSAKVVAPVPEPPVVDSADVAPKAIVAGVAIATRVA